jgi:hypothetical protein
VLGHFDWPPWSGTEEAFQLRDDAAKLANATEHQIAPLLTVIIRQERF